MGQGPCEICVPLTAGSSARFPQPSKEVRGRGLRLGVHYGFNPVSFFGLRNSRSESFPGSPCDWLSGSYGTANQDQPTDSGELTEVMVLGLLRGPCSTAQGVPDWRGKVSRRHREVRQPKRRIAKLESLANIESHRHA